MCPAAASDSFTRAGSGKSEGRSTRGTIISVDDDAGFRRWISGVLERAGYTTVGLATGEEALLKAEAKRPALVLLEVKLPGISGYEVCCELKERLGRDLAVFFLSGVRTEPFDRAAGLLVGADDYLVKPIDPDELLARVRRHVLPRGGGDATAAAAVPELTKREREVLDLLALGLDQGEIARSLVISQKTVATHIQHVLSKLGVHSRAQAVAFAHRSGLTETLQ
jgi:DNA-binding NarL/FixJ family response regulator